MLSPDSFARVLEALPTRFRVDLALRRIEYVRLEPIKYELPLGVCERGSFTTAHVYGIDAQSFCTRDDFSEDMSIVREPKVFSLMMLLSFRTFYSKRGNFDVDMSSNGYDGMGHGFYSSRENSSVVYLADKYTIRFLGQTLSCIQWSYDGERYTCEDVEAVLNYGRTVTDDVLIGLIKNEIATTRMSHANKKVLTRLSIMMLSFSDHIDIDVDFWDVVKFKIDYLI